MMNPPRKTPNRTVASFISPALIIVLAVPLLFCLCNPFVELGSNDDWVYAGTAKALANTGHLRFDQFGIALGIPQAVLGAAVIKLAGFSFSSLRALMIPITMACALLVYLMARWMGLSRWMSLFPSLGLLLSPVFLPVTTAFMTDGPALVLCLLTAWGVMRAYESSWPAAMRWVCFVVVLGVTAGTNRQMLWGEPLIMLPMLALLRRDDRRIRIAALTGTIAAGLGVLGCYIWMSHQALQPIRVRFPGLTATAAIFADTSARIFLTLCLFCMPAIALLLGHPTIWRRRLLWLIPAAVLVFAGVASWKSGLFFAPWLGNIVTIFGVLLPRQAVLGEKPIIVPKAASYAIGWAVALVLAVVLGLAPEIRRSIRQGLRPVRPDLPFGGDRFAAFVLLTLPFCIAYWGVMLLPALETFGFFDRYLLPLVAFAFLWITGAASRIPGRQIQSVAWALLLFMGIWAVATTHDAFRLWEAEARAANRMTRSGVARTCIEGGYEYDGWTQLTVSGSIPFINSRSLPSIPPGSPRFWFQPYAPSIKPRFHVVTSPLSALAPAVLEVPYQEWLGPHSRQVLVQEDPEVSCDSAGGK